MWFRNRLRLTFIIPFALTTTWLNASEPGALVRGKPVLLFICAGQSNMVGHGDAKAYNQQLSSAGLPRADIWSRVSNTAQDTGGWAPLGSHSPLGPEVSFALKLAEARPDHTIAILKIAKGGTPIEFWTPGQPDPKNSRAGHQALQSVIPDALADLERRKLSGEIPSFQVAGLVWMQGETNANGALAVKSAYQDELGRLLAFINEKAGTRHIPLVLGRISIQISPASVRESGSTRRSQSQGGKLPDDADHVNDGQKRGPIWHIQKLDHVRAAQEAFCAAYPRAAWVDIDDIPLRDIFHYHPSGYVEMGARFAAAMEKLLTPAR